MPVSVVLCTYNGVRYLPELWDSLLAQTRPPDQIVVRDDASTDHTFELFAQWEKQARVRGITVSLTRNERNLGFVGNFETALTDAAGDIVFLCDQDDVWHRDKIATMLDEFERRPRLLLLHSDARLVDERGEDMRRTLFQTLEVSRGELAQMHGGRAFDALLRRNLATGATLAFRRPLLKDVAPFPREWVHDEWLAIVAAVLGEVDCIQRALIDYRQHANNQIGAQSRNLTGKFARAAEPRKAYLIGLIDRTKILMEKLQTIGTPSAEKARQSARRKLAHLETRLAMPACRPCRVPMILREAIAGHYARYAMGARAVAYDLLGTD